MDKNIIEINMKMMKVKHRQMTMFIIFLFLTIGLYEQYPHGLSVFITIYLLYLTLNFIIDVYGDDYAKE